MSKERNSEIELIKNAIIESSEGCFAVKYESDCSGYHYVIYSEEGETDLGKLNKMLIPLNLSKRFIIILASADYIEFRRVSQK